MKTLLFVDDEPRVLQGLQRQLHIMRNEWTMNFTGDGAKALQFMEKTPVDVIITDMMMPGMDGAQLLTEVMKRHPNTVRVVLSGQADRESILRLVGPAHQYLSKPCDAEELRDAISRAFALRGLLASDKLKQLAIKLRTLPSLPKLHVQLTDELRQDEPSLERISDIISKDIGMSTKILQLVNSAFFGLPRQITNIQEAVIYLGIATVRSLVLSLQVFSQFDQKQIKGFSIDGLARHCWITGMLSRRIAEAEHCDPKVDDQCFLAGLLHDVGQLILASGLPDEYARVLNTVSARNQTIWEAERMEFGTTHAELGAYLLGLWGLPNPVIEAVALHYRPAEASVSEFSPVIAVHVANAFAHDQTNSHLEWPGNDLDQACIAQLKLDGHLEKWKERCFDSV
jgi:HD-like signal output (HDOD) protein/CheY-like chemotaxis protein